jgi:hypothetical protein
MVWKATDETRILTPRKKAASGSGLQLRGEDLNLRPLGYEFDLNVARVVSSTVYVSVVRWFCRRFGRSCPPNCPPVCPPTVHQQAIMLAGEHRCDYLFLRGQSVLDHFPRHTVRDANYTSTEQFPVAKIEETTPTSHQLPGITEAGRRCLLRGSDSTQQLLALCCAAVSDPWYLEGRFRELIGCATRHPKKSPRL